MGSPAARSVVSSPTLPCLVLHRSPPSTLSTRAPRLHLHAPHGHLRVTCAVTQHTTQRQPLGTCVTGTPPLEVRVMHVR